MTSHRNEKIQIDLDLGASPVSWVNSIFANADYKSADLIAKHLVAALLETRFSARLSRAREGHAKYRRMSVLTVGSLSYHVTARATAAVIRECKQSLSIGGAPILLVPNTQIGKSIDLVKKARAARRINIFGIENYVAFHVIVMSCDARLKPVQVFKKILRKYNQCIRAAGADRFLRIERVKTSRARRSRPEVNL